MFEVFSIGLTILTFVLRFVDTSAAGIGMESQMPATGGDQDNLTRLSLNYANIARMSRDSGMWIDVDLSGFRRIQEELFLRGVLDCVRTAQEHFSE